MHSGHAGQLSSRLLAPQLESASYPFGLSLFFMLHESVPLMLSAQHKSPFDWAYGALGGHCCFIPAEARNKEENYRATELENINAGAHGRLSTQVILVRAQWAGETSRGRKSPHLGVWGLTEFLKFFWLWITFTNTLVETPTHPHRDSLKHSDTHPNTDRHTHTQPEKTHTKTQAKRLRFIWLTFDLTLRKK